MLSFISRMLRLFMPVPTVGYDVAAITDEQKKAWWLAQLGGIVMLGLLSLLTPFALQFLFQTTFSSVLGVALEAFVFGWLNPIWPNWLQIRFTIPFTEREINLGKLGYLFSVTRDDLDPRFAFRRGAMTMLKHSLISPLLAIAVVYPCFLLLLSGSIVLHMIGVGTLALFAVLCCLTIALSIGNAMAEAFKTLADGCKELLNAFCDKYDQWKQHVMVFNTNDTTVSHPKTTSTHTTGTPAVDRFEEDHDPFEGEEPGSETSKKSTVLNYYNTGTGTGTDSKLDTTTPKVQTKMSDNEEGSTSTPPVSVKTKY